MRSPTIAPLSKQVDDAGLERAWKEVTSIEGFVRHHAAVQPDAPATTFDGRTISYGQLDERTNQIANGLAAEGVVPGDRIAIIDKNDHGTLEVLLGARKLGAIEVAVNWRLAPPEVAYILNDAEAGVLFVHQEFAGMLEGIAAATNVATKVVRKIIVFGNAPDHESFEVWLARQDATDPGHTSSADEIALLLYTSGTTGRPKGTMLANRNILSFIHSASVAFGTRPDGVHLICIPLFHVGGLVWSLFALAQGNHVVGMREFDPDALINAIPLYGVTHGMMVPAVIQRLLACPDARTVDFSTLQGITYGGSSISEKVLLDALTTFKCGLYGMYGATELSFGLTMLPPADHDAEKRPELLRSVGKPFPGTSMKIVDPATLGELGEEEIGEIWVMSPQRALGYWKRPEDSAATLREDGWYRSGDLGYFKDGYLYLNDRLNDMVVSGGENVYPAEIERVLFEHPEVSEAAVFGIPDDAWGESVAAAVVLTSGSKLTVAELKDFLRERLAHYKCPKLISFLDALPRTPSGKVQRFVLREPYWAGRSRRIN